MSSTGKRFQQDPPSSVETSSASIIMLDRSDVEMGSKLREDHPNDNYSHNESSNKSTLINIDDFIPSDIEDEECAVDHNKSTGTLIDIDALVEAHFRNNVVIDDDDDDDDGKKDKSKKNAIDTDDDIEVQNAKTDGTNSTDSTDNMSIASTNRKDRRQDANDSPHDVALDVLEVHELAQDVEDYDEVELTWEHWCNIGLLCRKTWGTIRGLCRNNGSLRYRLKRWIVAIVVFVIASGGIGAAVAMVKNTSTNAFNAAKEGVQSVHDRPTEAPTNLCLCDKQMYDSFGNPYGTFTGRSNSQPSYTIKIYYNKTGIYEEFPSLSCPIAEGTIDIDSVEKGYIQYFPTTDSVSANCVPGGTTLLEHDGSDKFIYKWTDGTTMDDGILTFECEMTC